MALFRQILVRVNLVLLVLNTLLPTKCEHLLISNSSTQRSEIASGSYPYAEEPVSTPEDSRSRVSVLDSGSISRKQYEVIAYVISRCLSPIATILGIAGNIASLLVFCHPTMTIQHSVSVYMKALCSLDLTYLSVSLIVQTIKLMIPINPGGVSKISAYVTSYVQRTVVIMLGASSQMVVVLIAIERFLAVCFPLWVAGSVLSRHPKIPIISVIVFNCIWFSVGFARFSVAAYYDHVYGMTMWRSVMSDFRIKEKAFFYYFVLVAEIIYRYLIVGIVVICNICTVICLWIAVKKRRTLTQAPREKQTPVKSKQEVKATRMLLGVATLFLLCMLPGSAQTFTTRMDPEVYFYRRQHYLYLVLTDILALLVKINSAANFLIYYSLNKCFRVTLKHICGFKVGTKSDVLESSRATASTQI